MKILYNIERIIAILLLLGVNPNVSHSQTNLNKFVRDYLKSSLIINYYSEDRALFEEIGLNSNVFLTRSGYKYVIEIKPFINTNSNTLEKFQLFEFYFDYVYTSDSSIWNSNLGITNIKLNKFKEVYKKSLTNPLSLYEVNVLHKKGLIAKANSGDLFIINNNESIIEGVTAVQKEKYELNNIQDVILLRYFHYSPQEIKINIENSSFSFYSNSLERYFNGKLIFQDVKNIYIMQLENGVLVYD